LVTNFFKKVKAANILCPLQPLDCVIPPQADSGWLDEACPGPLYLDKGSNQPENDFTNRNTTFMTWLLMHRPCMIKEAGGLPVRMLLHLVCFFNVVSVAVAKENSRPMSKGGDYIVELTTGVAFEESEGVFEVGFDIEKFIEGTRHHFSIGLATEVEFKEHGKEYYMGPLFSFYYHHFKLFLTSGILTSFREESEWKSRAGLGHEFIFSKHYVFIPTVALDYVNGETSFATNLGVSCEF